MVPNNLGHHPTDVLPNEVVHEVPNDFLDLGVAVQNDSEIMLVARNDDDAGLRVFAILDTILIKEILIDSETLPDKFDVLIKLFTAGGIINDIREEARVHFQALDIIGIETAQLLECLFSTFYIACDLAPEIFNLDEIGLFIEQRHPKLHVAIDSLLQDHPKIQQSVVELKEFIDIDSPLFIYECIFPEHALLNTLA